MLTIDKTYIENKIELEPKSDCWNWTGWIASNGYGLMRFNRKIRMAHRVTKHLYENFNLDSPLLVCHTCDNRKCVNPAHTFLGTHKDNTQDMINKGRAKPYFKGNKISYNAKLNENAVLFIRTMLQDASHRAEFIKDLAENYGVTTNTIRHIYNYKTWRNC